MSNTSENTKNTASAESGAETESALGKFVSLAAPAATLDESAAEPQPPVFVQLPSEKRSVKRTVLKITLRTLISLFSVLAVVFAGLYGVCRILCLGPSPHARDLFVISMKETSAMKFLPGWFLSDEEIEAILSANAVISTEEVTDPNLVVIPDEDDRKEDFDIDAIIIEEVSGPTFKGKMMIVNDPSRVYVGISGAFGSNLPGKTVMDMIEKDNAIGGVNGGGFEDTGGVGLGGQPLGIVISQGKLLCGSPAGTYEVIGMDSQNKLVVGKMTGQEALDRGMRDAISFGPILVVNGEPVEITGTGGGLNPRTAIGQRADGAMLILCVEGRQSNSLGATYGDLVDIFTDYKAVNAANLDGGSSSHMIYEGEIISLCSSLYGPRKLPTSILVSRKEGE